MKKIVMLVSSLIICLFVLSPAYAMENPRVIYDGLRHEFRLDNINENDFFNEFKGVIPGDTRSQTIEFDYQNISKKSDVYLKATCDEEAKNLFKDMTANIYVNNKLLIEKGFVFDDMHIDELTDSKKQNLRIEVQIPTSIGNEISGKSIHIKWVITIHEIESNSEQLDRVQDNELVINNNIKNNQESVEENVGSSNSYTAIIDEDVPQSRVVTNESSWALFNFIAMVVTIILSIPMYISNKDKEEKNDEIVEKNNHHLILTIISSLLSIISIVVFILTEDMTLDMIIFDDYTLIMLVILMVNMMILIISQKMKKSKVVEKH